LVENFYVQEQVHTPLDTWKFPVYAPISAGDPQRFRVCIAGTSKHAVDTLLSERERGIVGAAELSIGNRPITEKLKSQQDQGKTSHSNSRC